MTVRPAHWARRFFESIRPGRPKSADVEWAHGFLSARERVLFDRMSNPDKRHAVRVARQVHDRLREHATPAVMAAALLHDVGKTVAGLGTYGRVVATLSLVVAGDNYAREWQKSSGLTRKVGLYLRSPQLGADLLSIAESDDLTVAWAREHHSPPEEWTVPIEIGHVLRDADR